MRVHLLKMGVPPQEIPLKGREFPPQEMGLQGTGVSPWEFEYPSRDGSGDGSLPLKRWKHAYLSKEKDKQSDSDDKQDDYSDNNSNT